MADEPPRRRVGRPPLDPNDRSITLNVRVPPRDYDAVYSEASRQRLTMAQWVRATIQRQLLTCRARLQAALTPERFSRLTADLMFSASCLCCGKALTDPASMARWIGPECAHNSSLIVPRVFLVDETQESLLAK
jgi:hypothetical protein